MRIKKRKTNSYQGHRNITAEPLEDRRLLSVSVGSSVLVFNSAMPGTPGAGPSHVDALTLTNTGSSPISIPTNAVTIVADANASSEQAVSTPSAFAVTNLSSVPSSLAPGQSFSLDLQYTASQVGVMFQSAILQVQTSDSTVSVPLHGLSTSGQFGTAEPSLVQILRANDIPTIVGAGPNDSNYLNSQYPINPDPSSTELTMPRLVKAGSGPVTITPLAAFNASAQPTVRFGNYIPGDPSDLTELFTISQSDAQTVNPSALGVTSFDPGASAFGLYATYPGTTTSNGKPDTHYSEGALNTLDPSHPQKFRFFPLKNVDGSVVPNAYIVASEDYNSTQFNSFVNFVGIINNVKPAADATGAAVLGLTNPQSVPSTTRLVFNRIQNRDPQDPAGFTDIVHDTNSLVINNTGDSPLNITALMLSDTTNWQLSNPPSLPAVVQPGGSLTLSIKFIAVSDPPHTNNQTNDTTTTNGLSVTAAGGVWDGALTISSNDPVNPSRAVQLAGYWQNTSESENEPGLQTIVNSMFGYGTTISSSQQPDFPNNGKTPVPYGEEVQSAYWNVSDPTLPVSVVQLDSYHSQYDLSQNPPFATSALVGWYPQGSANNVKGLFHTVTGEGQSVLPYASGGSTAVPASGSFAPSGTFGWYLDGERSDNALNTTDINTYGRSGHAVRIYPVRDSSGNLIPNTWLLGLDYQDTQFDNSDFQDNLYLVSNMRPTIQAPAPQTASATVGQGGVTIEWTPVSDPTLQGYNIYRSASPNGTYALLNTSPVSGFSFADGSAPSGGSSYYRITAVDASGESEGTAASVLAGPPAPASVLATPQGSSGAVVTWAASSGATSYDVFRQLAGDSSFTQAATGIAGTSFTDSGLSAGATYTYEVRAVGATGASGFTLAAPITTPQGAAPAAPSGLTAAAGGTFTINLTWADNASNESGFLIERSSGGSTFVQIASVPANTTTYADVGLTASTTYVYRVRATNSAGNSDYTLPQAATTTALSAGAPAKPTNLTATTTNQGQISLAWVDNSGGAATFAIFRAIGTGAFTQLTTVAAGVTSYLDSAVTGGATYSYEVQALANGIPSDFSNLVTVSTTAAAAGGFKVNLGAGASKTLKFRDADGTIATITWRGPGSAVLSFGGTGLSQSTVRGITTVSSTASLDSLIASGTTGGTSITITTKGGNKAINLGTVSINGALGHLTAATTNLTDDLTATGAINQLTLSSATGGTINAQSIKAATFGGAFSDSLDLTTLGSFRSGSITGGVWAITGKLTSLTVSKTFAMANVVATMVGTMSLGKITTANGGLPFGITIGSATQISGTAGGKRFTLRKITTTTNVSALLLAQHIVTGDFSIQTSSGRPN